VGQAFNEMTSALEEGERLRQNLVADVAHELRTPLSVLQGNLRALLDDVYPLEKAEIAGLYDETRLLSRLVDDLRELAQAEAGQLSFNLRPTDVGDVLRTTVTNFEPAAEAKAIGLMVKVADKLPPATSDPDRLAQVLRNLLTNALRHTPEGGQVTVSATTAGDAVEIAVADNGEGIAPEDLPHVFDRFYRGDRSRSRAEGSAGLGLAIVRAIVEAHGGQVRAASDGPGQGSTFRFTLPVA
jgi:two-component system OmpR family sensor kinase